MNKTSLPFMSSGYILILMESGFHLFVKVIMFLSLENDAERFT